MNIGNFIVCPKCNGRGTVLDKVASMFTLGIWNLMEAGLNDDEKMTRENCPTCSGKKFIKVE